MRGYKNGWKDRNHKINLMFIKKTGKNRRKSCSSVAHRALYCEHINYIFGKADEN